MFFECRHDFYLIDRSRGAPTLVKFSTTEFEETLVTDSWGAYDAVARADRQMCLVHLLRESEHGSDCQAKMMSIFRTLKQRGHDPIRTIISATQDDLKSGKPPPLPQKIPSLG